jgi:hypothetical protein
MYFKRYINFYLVIHENRWISKVHGWEKRKRIFFLKAVSLRVCFSFDDRHECGIFDKSIWHSFQFLNYILLVRFRAFALFFLRTIFKVVQIVYCLIDLSNEILSRIGNSIWYDKFIFLENGMLLFLGLTINGIFE